MRHGQHETIGDYDVTHLDPMLSLGRTTKVSAMFRAQKQGDSAEQACLIFVIEGTPTCYRHMVCPARPVIDEIRERETPERRAEAVSP